MELLTNNINCKPRISVPYLMDIKIYNQNIPPGCILCAWCAKVGMKLFTLRTATGCKAFCSELCFTQCRRASFKKNKICDWCKHVRHTVNYVDFQDGEQQLQFCSNKCLNQYKMNIFCNETKAHLHLNPNLTKESSKVTPISKSSNLITPDLWLKDFKNGENENNSVNSFKDSSDSDSELELEDSQSIVRHSLKRKFSEFPKENNDFKPNDKQKYNSTKEKSTKESKRIKHSNKALNTSRQTPGAKHSNSKHLNSDFGQTNEWNSRENKDKTSSFHSSSYRPTLARHSPILPSVPPIRTSIVAPNHNIPLFNGNSAVNSSIRSAVPPLNPMAPNGSPSGQLFPRLPGNIGRADHPMRASHMPSPTFAPRVPPMHNMLGTAHMEMLMRMQSGFAGLRHPLPFPPHPPTGHPFTGMPLANGLHSTSGSPLIQPSLQPNGSLPTQMYPNLSLLPPMTVMVPYPVPIPIPIPIPVPFLFPVRNDSKSENGIEINKNNIQMNISSSNDVTTTSYHNTNGSNNGSTPMSSTSGTTASKVESVITKLVERKTKANNNCVSTVEPTEDNSSSIENESLSDDSRESLPQNLVVSRDKRSLGLPYSPVSHNGYRVP